MRVCTPASDVAPISANVPRRHGNRLAREIPLSSPETRPLVVSLFVPKIRSEQLMPRIGTR